MNSLQTGRVNISTVQRAARIVEIHGGAFTCDIGVPVTQDEYRPYMNGAVSDAEKERSILRLRNIIDTAGARCLLYSLEPVDISRLFGLPVHLSGETLPELTTYTIEGSSTGSYRSLEGSISVTDGTVWAHATTVEGHIDVIDTGLNGVPAKFSSVLLAACIAKTRN